MAEAIRLGDRDGVEPFAAEAGSPHVGHHPGQRHAGTLLSLRSHRADGPHALPLLEQAERGHGNDADESQGHEQLGERHGGSVDRTDGRVNVQEC